MASAGSHLTPPSGLRRSPSAARLGRIIAATVGLAAIAMIPWTAFLAYSLPRRYDAHHWSLLWVGFDIIVCAVLAAFAWLTWKRRQLMLVMAIIAGTLLFCDAWFDVITSWGNSDHWITVITAVFAEVPLAVFMYWLAYRAIRRSLAAYYAILGNDERGPGLLRAPAIYLAADQATAAAVAKDDDDDPCRTSRLEQARAGVRSVTDELHEALDSLSLISNDTAVDRCGIQDARTAIEHALAAIDADQPPLRK